MELATAINRERNIMATPQLVRSGLCWLVVGTAALALTTIAYGDDCVGKVIKTHSDGPPPTDTWSFTCIGSCGSGPTAYPCYTRTSGSGTYQYCGCNGAEQGCCHEVMRGYLNELGEFVGTGYGHEGDCVVCPNQHGQCKDAPNPLGGGSYEYTSKCE